jgi:pimeloyl-ACP methyl ester carboxylesterase
MKKYPILVLFFTLSSLLLFGDGKSEEKKPQFFTHKEPGRLTGKDEITFVLRMPKGWSGELEKTFSGTPKPSVRGVLAICNYADAPHAARNALEEGKPGSILPLIRFADDNNLAMISWTNIRGYSTSVSGDELSDKEYKEYDRAFGERVREWRRGFERMADRFHLPKTNVLLYGHSGGGQVAHRLAMRVPEYFFAIHIHINSSYDIPTAEGKRVLWLVTTGTREYGYPAAQRFYRDALGKGYHMIFRAEENLGHHGSPATTSLGLAFFEFCMKFIPDAQDPNWQKPPEDVFYFMRYPTHIGDYFNHIAFPREQAKGNVERQWMVALPTREIAEKWGMVIEGSMASTESSK